ncbi:MAG: pseudouridine synthase, partial [Bacteroidota bacterium]
MKLDKYIAESGYASRRKALLLIEEKQVRVNGKLANVFTPVKDSDSVTVGETKLNLNTVSPTFIMYNKPKGIICTSEKIDGNIIDAIRHPQQIYPVGRLDKDSEGLILLTNQSLLIDQIANPSGEHEKEYLVTLNHPVRTKFLEDIANGIKIGKEETKPCKAILEPGTKRVMRITITQGLNRQIRKMCNVYQYQVIKLQRVRVMNIQLGYLKLGEWRDLSDDEIKGLMAQIKKQSKIDKKKPSAPVLDVKIEKKIEQKGGSDFMLIPKTEMPPEKPKRLKKHEIKAKQKEPWKKMQAANKKAPTKPKLSTL